MGGLTLPLLSFIITVVYTLLHALLVLYRISERATAIYLLYVLS